MGTGRPPYRAFATHPCERSSRPASQSLVSFGRPTQPDEAGRHEKENRIRSRPNVPCRAERVPRPYSCLPWDVGNRTPYYPRHRSGLDFLPPSRSLGSEHVLPWHLRLTQKVPASPNSPSSISNKRSSSSLLFPDSALRPLFELSLLDEFCYVPLFLIMFLQTTGSRFVLNKHLPGSLENIPECEPLPRDIRNRKIPTNLIAVPCPTRPSKT